MIDINDDNLSVHRETTTKLVEKITDKEIPVLTVYNKVDKILDDKITTLSTNDIIYISAKDKYNIELLIETVDSKINGSKGYYSLKIPNDQLKIYYWLYENRITENVEFDGEGVSLKCLLYDNEKAQYENFLIGDADE